MPDSATQNANCSTGAENNFRIPSMVFDDSTDANSLSPTPDPSRSSPTRNIPGAVRRVSDSIDVLANSEMPRAGTLSPTNDNQWSSAVGHATTNGKSGRVIERLMAENDRLKRELELQILRSQELERNLETTRPQIEALRTENDNLKHANSMDGTILARRDRKIEQLKADVATERSRREASDQLARRLERQNEESQDTAKRDVQMAHEEAKHATTHASILEQSHRQLASEYRQRAERWQKDIAVLQAQRQSDREKMDRIDVINEHMRTEADHLTKMHEDMTAQWDEYTKANEEWKASLEDVANFENGKMRKLSEDMETITNKMKWVMSLKSSREGNARSA
jgi:DNA repair exonuclease SbcCD ATPase subunit